jgi:putative flippase GtrA
LIIEKIKNEFFNAQFLRFLLVGGFSALVNYFSGYFLRENFSRYLSFEASVATGFIIGAIMSFILNKIYTFGAHGEKTSIQLVKFLLIVITSTALASFLAFLCMKTFTLLNLQFGTKTFMESVARVLSIVGVTFYNFLTMKYLAFNKVNISPDEGAGKAEVS